MGSLFLILFFFCRLGQIETCYPLANLFTADVLERAFKIDLFDGDGTRAGIACREQQIHHAFEVATFITGEAEVVEESEGVFL